LADEARKCPFYRACLRQQLNMCTQSIAQNAGLRINLETTMETLFWWLVLGAFGIFIAKAVRDYFTNDAADEIHVVKEENGSFQVKSAGRTVLSLSEQAAVQVHRFLAPVRDGTNLCSCSCVKRDLTGYRMRQVNDEEPVLVTIRDSRNNALTLTKSAASKLHFMLRPTSCPCECGAHGTGPAYAHVPRGPSGPGFPPRVRHAYAEDQEDPRAPH
jgi:hypothetical protein